MNLSPAMLAALEALDRRYVYLAEYQAATRAGEPRSAAPLGGLRFIPTLHGEITAPGFEAPTARTNTIRALYHRNLISAGRWECNGLTTPPRWQRYWHLTKRGRDAARRARGEAS